jgi:hypothetical protein
MQSSWYTQVLTGGSSSSSGGTQQVTTRNPTDEMILEAVRRDEGHRGWQKDQMTMKQVDFINDLCRRQGRSSETLLRGISTKGEACLVIQYLLGDRTVD